MAVESGFRLNQIVAINDYVKMCFDRLTHATVSGYQEELGKIVMNKGKDKNLLATIFQ